MSEYVDVKDLPGSVQAALKSVRYGSSNIKVETSATVVLAGAGGGGYKSYAILVDLNSGQFQSVMGSWGGANAFNRSNAVDNDDRPYALPGHGVAITGSIGGGQPTSAVLHIPTSMVSRILTVERMELPEIDLIGLFMFGEYTSAYRKEEIARREIPASVFDSLVERGLLKRNRAGATQITTAGRNALGKFRAPHHNY